MSIMEHRRIAYLLMFFIFINIAGHAFCQLTIEAQVDPNNGVLEVDETNNSMNVDVDVVETNTFNLVYIPISVSEDEYKKEVNKNSEFLLATYPLLFIC